MTARNEEQTFELEALQSIFPDELTVDDSGDHVKLLIDIKGPIENDEETADCTLEFVLPERYPEVVPEIELTLEGPAVTDDDVVQLSQQLNDLALENIGMSMVYTLVSFAQEELTNVCERWKTRQVEDEVRKKEQEEELERKRFEGTRVTVESFLAWKTKFDAEMASKSSYKVVQDPATRRATGRQQFLQDESLVNSDMKFLEEAGQDMKIDEDLFDDVGSDFESEDEDIET